MNQTTLSRYDQSRTDHKQVQTPSEKALTEESDSNSKEEKAGLNADEEAVLDYVQQHGHLMKEELHHHSGLPANKLDGLLESLKNRGLIEVSSGYTVIQIQSKSEKDRSGGSTK